MVVAIAAAHVDDHFDHPPLPSPTMYTIDQGGSTECTGTLTDTGGPNGNYSDNEQHAFSICPTDPFGCLVFELSYFHIEAGSELFAGDQMIFFEGSTTTGDTLATLASDGGLGINNSGGGVCLRVETDSCMTIQFTSDGDINLEGFLGEWFCTSDECTPSEPLQVTPNADKATIIEATTSSITQAQVDTIRCADGAYGTFISPPGSDLGLDKGLILTTGATQHAIGPNTLPDATTINFLPGDADLDTLSLLFGNGVLSTDACVVELSVRAFTNELTFEYSFGSEEYPEFVNSEFNDIFALLISGPGIDDGIAQIGGQKNLAVLPDGDFVQINSVNHESNWPYYRNNANGLSIGYDGLTSDSLGIKKSLTARATVIPCSTYRLKFAIADRGDPQFDSGVFISEISGGQPAFSLRSPTNDANLMEGCGNGLDSLIVELAAAFTDTVRFAMHVSGTAILDTDYTLTFTDTITFIPGESSMVFPIQVFDDGIDEGTETIRIQLTGLSACGTFDFAEFEILLFDPPQLEFAVPNDTVRACAGDVLQLQVSGADGYQWQPAAYVSDTTIANPSVTTDTSRWYVVEGFIDGFENTTCRDRDSIFVAISAPMIELHIDSTHLCLGGTIAARVVVIPDTAQIVWSDNVSVMEEDADFILQPQQPGIQAVVAHTSVNDCFVSDTVWIDVETLVIPETIIGDTTICDGQSIELAPGALASGDSYTWTPIDFLDDPNAVNPTATPDSHIVYTLHAQNASGFCRDSAVVDIEVIQNVSIQGDEIQPVCLGDTLRLALDENASGATWRWEPASLVVGDPTLASVRVVTTSSIWVFVRQLHGDCASADSVFIRVDSLPDLAIQAIPDDAPYCIGETVTLISPGFDPDDFPLIQHKWASAPGIQTGLGNLNLALTVIEDHYYARLSQNGACSSTDSFFIDVHEIDAQLSVGDTAICAGTAFDVSVMGQSTIDSVQWTPEITCSSPCLQGTIMAEVPTVFEAEVFSQGCSETEEIRVDITPPETLVTAPEHIRICPGEPFDLEVVASRPIANVEWQGAQQVTCSGNCASATLTANTGLITAQVLFDDGCTGLAQTMVDEAIVPDLEITADPSDAVLVGNTVNVILTTDPPLPDDAMLQWTVLGFDLIDNETEISINLIDTETIVRATVTTADGCVVVDSLVLMALSPEFIFPRVFVPNSQIDSNRIFTFSIKNPPDFDLDQLSDIDIEDFSIYDRWGQRVFQCTEVDCLILGWDGTKDGEALPSGSYIYTFQAILPNQMPVRCTDAEGRRVTCHGDVLLLR